MYCPLSTRMPWAQARCVLQLSLTVFEKTYDDVCSNLSLNSLAIMTTSLKRFKTWVLNI